MAEETRSGGGGNAWLAFIVGALVVVVAVLGYMAYTGYGPFARNHNVDVKIEAPKIEAPKLPAAPTPEMPTAPPENTPSQ
jgi:hypothetical protein